MRYAKFVDKVRFVPFLHVLTLFYYFFASLRYPGYLGRLIKSALLALVCPIPFAWFSLFFPNGPVLWVISCAAFYCAALGFILPMRNGVLQQIALRSSK